MTTEMIAKAKECKSVDELLALAKENDMEMTVEQAEEVLQALHAEGELTDDELDAASGGGCAKTSAKDRVGAGDLFTFKDGEKCKKCKCKIFLCNGYIRTPALPLMSYECHECGADYAAAFSSSAIKKYVG